MSITLCFNQVLFNFFYYPKKNKSVVQLCEEKCTLTHNRRYVTLIIFDLAKMINHHWAFFFFFFFFFLRNNHHWALIDWVFGFSFFPYFFRGAKLGCLFLLKYFYYEFSSLLNRILTCELAPPPNASHVSSMRLHSLSLSLSLQKLP